MSEIRIHPSNQGGCTRRTQPRRRALSLVPNEREAERRHRARSSRAERANGSGELALPVDERRSVATERVGWGGSWLRCGPPVARGSRPPTRYWQRVPVMTTLGRTERSATPSHTQTAPPPHRDHRPPQPTAMLAAAVARKTESFGMTRELRSLEPRSSSLARLAHVRSLITRRGTRMSVVVLHNRRGWECKGSARRTKPGDVLPNEVRQGSGDEHSESPGVSTAGLGRACSAEVRGAQRAARVVRVEGLQPGCIRESTERGRVEDFRPTSNSTKHEQRRPQDE